jgi:hypothetical protein
VRDPHLDPPAVLGCQRGLDPFGAETVLVLDPDGLNLGISREGQEASLRPFNAGPTSITT